MSKTRSQIALEMYRPRYPFLFQMDSYMHSFHRQLPPGITDIYNYFSSRGGKYDKVVFFGLQEDLVNFSGNNVISKEMLDWGFPILKEHFFDLDIVDEEGFRSLLEKHKGALPLEIKALPEGIIVPANVPLFTVHATDPEFQWLATAVETSLSHNWATTTAATKGWHDRRLVGGFMLRTNGHTLGLDYKIHDFGQRGSSSDQSAARVGAAYILNSKGSDTLLSVPWLMAYYDTEKVWSNSIAAMCHMTVTSWTRPKESKAYKNMCEEFPEGFIAMVSDSYDIYHTCKEIFGKELKATILKRNGVTVIRPDSGYAPKVVIDLLTILGEAFGTEMTPQGYKMLNPKVRMIWGDGINSEMFECILQEMCRSYWAADNIAFGEGGERHQKIHRDLLKMAYKCSAAEIDGEWVGVSKDPVTDPGKKSLEGRFSVIEDADGIIRCVPFGSVPEEQDLLKTVFLNGVVTKKWTFEEVLETHAHYSSKYPLQSA